MKFFASMKDHVLSLPLFLGLSADSGIVMSSDSVLNVLR